jgi:hypothetical protein
MLNVLVEDSTTVERKRIADLPVEELRAHCDALIKSAGVDMRPPPEIKTFPVQ